MNLDLHSAIADTLNREYQAGGDAQTLASVARSLADVLSQIDGPLNRSLFYDVCEMGGLDVFCPQNLPTAR